MLVRNISLNLPIQRPKVYNLMKFPLRIPVSLITSLKNKVVYVFHLFARLVQRKRDNATSEGVGSLPRKRIKLSPKTSKIFKYTLLLIVVGSIIVGSTKFYSRGKLISPADERYELGEARATQNVNREFSFPLKNEDGEVVSSIKYKIEKAEIRDQIIVEGKKATAIKGRTFLIVTLKITNEYTQAIQINTKDYIRLSVNGNRDEWLAPDIHNDPVEIQAISTKYTRVGFPINDSDKNLILRVGEIEGEKQEIELSLK